MASSTLKLLFNRRDRKYHLCAVGGEDRVLRDFGAFAGGIKPSQQDYYFPSPSFQFESGQTIYVDEYTSYYDSVTDAINNASSDAGSNGKLVFTPQKEYILNGTIRLNNPSQIWEGNNCILRHKDTFVGPTVLVGPTVDEVAASITAGTTLYPFFAATYRMLRMPIFRNFRIWYKNSAISSDYPVSSSQAAGWTGPDTPIDDNYGNVGLAIHNCDEGVFENIEVIGFNKGILLYGWGDGCQFNIVRPREIRDCKFGVYHYASGPDSTNKGWVNVNSIDGPADVRWLDGCPNVSGGYAFYYDYESATPKGFIIVNPRIRDMYIDCQTISAGMPSGSLYANTINGEFSYHWEGLNHDHVARLATKYYNQYQVNGPHYIAAGTGATASTVSPGGTVLVFAQNTSIGTKTVQGTQLSCIGTTIIFKAFGYFQTPGTTERTFQWTLRWGSTTIAQSEAISMQTNANVCQWMIEAMITVRTAGSSGVIHPIGQLRLSSQDISGTRYPRQGGATLDILNYPMFLSNNPNHTVTGVDLTSAAALDLLGLVSNADSSIGGTACYFEVVGP